MKINKAVALCKKNGMMQIYDTPSGVQWLSNSVSAFPLINIPMFTPEMLCSTYDINEKQQEKIVLRQTRIDYDIKDFVPDEEQAEEYGIMITYNSKTLIPLRTTEGLYFIDKNMITPINDMTDCFFWYRISKNGNPLFAIKRGLELVGLICPVVGVVDEIFTEKLKELYEECRMLMLNGEKNAD